MSELAPAPIQEQLQVTDALTCRTAKEQCRLIKTWINEVERHYDPQIKAFTKAKADLNKRQATLKAILANTIKKPQAELDRLIREIQVFERKVDRQEEALVSAPKVSGFYSRKRWVAEIVDPNLVPRQYMDINVQLLNQLAAEYRERLNIPGVVAREKETPVVEELKG